jgi:hypothetical protein
MKSNDFSDEIEIIDLSILIRGETPLSIVSEPTPMKVDFEQSIVEDESQCNDLSMASLNSRISVSTHSSSDLVEEILNKSEKDFNEVQPSQYEEEKQPAGENTKIVCEDLSPNASNEFLNKSHEDSPLTIKIRAVVNEEVDRLLEHRPSPIKVNLVEPVSKHRSLQADKFELIDIFAIQKRLEEEMKSNSRELLKKDAVDVVINVGSEVKVDLPSTKSDSELLKENLRLMQETLLQNRKPHRQMARLPGRQKSFIDSETERVSKIMKGVLGSTIR